MKLVQLFWFFFRFDIRCKSWCLSLTLATNNKRKSNEHLLLLSSPLPKRNEPKNLQVFKKKKCTDMHCSTFGLATLLATKLNFQVQKGLGNVVNNEGDGFLREGGKLIRLVFKKIYTIFMEDIEQVWNFWILTKKRVERLKKGRKGEKG